MAMKQDMINLSLCLTPEEVANLTGCVRARAQIKALVLMGVRHLIRPDGTPAVLRTSLSDVASSDASAADTGRKRKAEFKFRYDLLK